jgi:hypothetical protein
MKTSSSMRRLAWALLALAAFPSLTLAATKPRKPKAPPAGTRESDRPELFAGVSYMPSGDVGLKGVELAGAVPFRGPVRLVLDLALHSGSSPVADVSQQTLLLGAERSWSGKLRPFARVLLGATRIKTETLAFSESGTHMAGAVGGGVAYLLSSQWGVRGQFELFLVNAGGWQTDPRYAAGVTYRLR